MRNNKTMRLSIIAGFFICQLCTDLSADVFSVTDSHFSGGIYDFTYYSHTNKAYVNGTEVSFGSLVMTNTGLSGPTTEGGANYWYANGYSDAAQLAGDVTLGWDLSAVTAKLGQVELLTNAALFQFSPWTAHAFEDKLYGEIATPGAFGSGAYTRYFEFEGNNDTSTSTLTNYTLLQDVTSNVSTSWLNDPGLFELKLGYQQHARDSSHPNIPGKHLQVFRNDTVPGNASFQFRLTAASTATVPEPSSFAGLLLVSGAVYAGHRHRRRQSR